MAGIKLRSIPNQPSDDGPIVLLVDDERSALYVFGRLLEEHGVPHARVASADAAVLILEARDVSVVVADYVMAVRDGVSLLNEVKRRWPATDRILLSGYFDSDLVLVAHESGHLALSKVSPGIAVSKIARLHRLQCAMRRPK